MHVLIKKKEIPLESSPAKLNQNFLIWWLTFGDVLPTRAALWSHLHQRASRAAPAGGKASDPDTEGEAQHGQSRKSVTMVFTFSYLVYSICTLFLNGDNNNGNSEHWQTNYITQRCINSNFCGRCRCGCNSRSLKLKTVTTLEWLYRSVTADILSGLVYC